MYLVLVCLWPPPRRRASTLFPYTTLFRSGRRRSASSSPRSRWRAGSTGSSSCRRELDPVEPRSEEHTSELQSHSDLVCRLLLEKKKKKRCCIRSLVRKRFNTASCSALANG